MFVCGITFVEFIGRTLVFGRYHTVKVVKFGRLVGENSQEDLMG